jgi:hypothetical protein
MGKDKYNARQTYIYDLYFTHVHTVSTTIGVSKNDSSKYADYYECERSTTYIIIFLFWTHTHTHSFKKCVQKKGSVVTQKYA